MKFYLSLIISLFSYIVFGQATIPFITTWETTTANESITIPTTGNGYNYTVNWGDGAITNGENGDAIHTYATAGTYTVSITGNFPRIYFNSFSGSSGTTVEMIVPLLLI